MKTDILISGFGGQGLMSLGKIIARAALSEGKEVSWFPSYGAEMRGGTAHCFVKICDKPIASPLIDYPDVAIILNKPSFEKFKNSIKKDCLLIINSDLADSVSLDKNIRSIRCHFNKVALECGNPRVANSVVLGLLIANKNNFLKKESVVNILKAMFKDKKQVLDANLKGFLKGQELLKKI
ncbi:MAG: 2-oxoacid:acceptor oxidoreductase family protein [Candidatus Omnitrophica bacterium]|nr:2-oxoacid:acceptor oxidoreductase family protein [Candidatus Omnitrophota bacterium]